MAGIIHFNIWKGVEQSIRDDLFAAALYVPTCASLQVWQFRRMYQYWVERY
jgi:hypothetical protein